MKPIARVLTTLALAASMPAMAAIDVYALWNYAQPAESEQRFRAALAGASGDDELILRTQIARTFSLRKRFDEANAELDAIAPRLATAGPAPRVHALLERGRTLRSGGAPAQARPLFVEAFELAQREQLEYLAADALHMVALVEPGIDGQIEWNRRTAEYAAAARDPRAQGWAAAAWNNLGVALNEAKRHDEALAAFEKSLVAYQRKGGAGEVRVAKWMLAHTERLLGRNDAALAAQLALERECAEAGEPDPYVFEELALLYAARGDADRAAHYQALQKKSSSGG